MSQSPVTLHIYDLSPYNTSLYPFGFGTYHSGLEIHGVEYTFGTEGAFTHEPKQAYGVVFRESVEVGKTTHGSATIQKMVDEISREFNQSGYNVLSKNCNCYTRALAERVLGSQCTYPGWVNRMASIGSMFSCLIPEEALNGQQVPSSADGVSSTGGASFNAFSGTGRSLGSTASTSSTSNSWYSGWFTRSDSNSSYSQLKPDNVNTDEDNVSLVATDREKILRATQSRLRNKSPERFVE